MNNQFAKIKKLNDGQEMPSLGLGTWLSQPGEVYKIVKEAVKSGYRHIDCAAIYKNEAEVGQALSELFAEGVVKREELFITSKLWNDSHHPDDVKPAIEKTLSDLKLDYLNLYLIHWPVAFKSGVIFPETPDQYVALDEIPIIETYQAMQLLKDSGLTKSIGVSNFSEKKLKDLIEKADVAPAVNQVELHPYLQQSQLVKYCSEVGVYLTAYSPLGSSGRPPQMLADDEPSLLGNPVLIEIAKKTGKSPAQVALNWALCRDSIVIPKTVTPSRAIENLSAQDFQLDQESIETIDSLEKGYRYVNGKFFTAEGSPYTYENLWDE